MASVTLESISKLYGRAKVLHEVSLDIQDGEFVVLVGPSGCGKSTLLRMIAGLECISDGTISIGNHVVNDVPPTKRDIAMVFQSYALYPHMTVRDNMAFSLKLAGRSKTEIDAAVTKAADTLGIGALVDRYPHQLSGGQCQRVAMGRAIVRNPQVFLFDEPLSNLDAKLRVTLRTEIKALHQRLRTTTIYVTHDQIEAMTMADKIVIMKDGFVEQIGQPLDLYDSPANLFVAGFIGSPAMNFLSGAVESAQGGPVFAAEGGGRLPLPADIAETLASGRLVYGIRPEHFLLADESSGIEGEIDVVEPTGSETLLYFHIGTDRVTAVFRERIDGQPGQKIWLRPDLSKIHLFNRDTGATLSMVSLEAV